MFIYPKSIHFQKFTIANLVKKNPFKRLDAQSFIDEHSIGPDDLIVLW